MLPMASSSSLLFLLSIPLLISASYPLHYERTPVGAPQPPPPSSSAASLLSPILSNLGFQELAMAVPSLSSTSTVLSSPFSSPVTLFAPSDDSICSCRGGASSCSAARILMEHLVPGVFPLVHLSKLSFGTKLETISPNRCLTVTSTAAGSVNSGSNSTVKIFVDGVEITRPDLFNDGKIVIHGIQGFIAPLSPFSCLSDRNPLDIAAAGAGSGAGSMEVAAVMLRDAIVRLRAGGYSILALAMRIKGPELVGLQNMTVFALDDPSIFGGGHAYITEVRFHVVPNQLLMHSDLVRLPAGTVLPTLVRGQHLVVTQGGVSEPFGSGLRINYVPIKNPEVVSNSKIVVHSLYFPFPHMYLADQAYAMPVDSVEGILESSDAAVAPGVAPVCGSPGSPGGCKMAPAPAPAPAPAAVSGHLVANAGHDENMARGSEFLNPYVLCLLAATFVVCSV